MVPIEEQRIAWLRSLRHRMFAGLAILLLLVMIVLGLILRYSLLDDSLHKTTEISGIIQASIRNLMLARDQALIQQTFENINKADGVVRAFLVNPQGVVVYSPDATEVGRKADLQTDPVCATCHSQAGNAGIPKTIVTYANGREVLRHSDLIANERDCQQCHDPSESYTGMIILDRDLKSTRLLIAKTELIVACAGIVALLLLGFLWSRSANRYAHEIIQREEELSSLYVVVKRLSQFINIEDIEQMIAAVMHDVFDAQSVDIILPRDEGRFYCIQWPGDGGKGIRTEIKSDTPLRADIEQWLYHESFLRISEDGGQIHMAIVRNNAPLVYLVIYRPAKKLNPVELRLAEAIERHVAIAFENVKLYTIAVSDALTGLYTRRHFDYCIRVQLERAMANGNVLSLAMIDLDDFKKVNDSFGHPVGDRVLREVGYAVLAELRCTDLAFRYGGDEMAVLLPGACAAETILVTERIRKRIFESIFTGAQTRFSVSIGIAAAPEHSSTILGLMAAADTAMYQAKASGKNNSVVYSKPASASVTELA